MKSMTGYGKAIYLDENYEIQIEIKSVNSKTFDMKISNYKELFFLENEIKEMVFSRIKRGKIDVRINFRDKQVPDIKADYSRLLAYYQMILKIKRELNLLDKIRLENIIGQPDVIIVGTADYDSDEFRLCFFQCLKQALDKHQELALKEGLALKIFFETSLRTISISLKSIRETIPAHREKLKENLITAVKQILNTDYTPEMEKRILVETALYLERCDITEELTRMDSHLANIRNYLDKDIEEIGKSSTLSIIR
jgi:uncharacterized protein (TIGR00255 family)